MAVFFTIEEAEELLPYIESRLYELREKIMMAQRTTQAIDGGLRSEINRIVRDIEETGCILRDVELGIVDFPAIRKGRAVMLCWKLGEEGIRYWHQVEGGFTLRRRIRYSDFYTKRDMENNLLVGLPKEPLTSVERANGCVVITIDARGVPEHAVGVAVKGRYVRVMWSWKGWEYSRAFHVGNGVERIEKVYRNGVLEVKVLRRPGRGVARA